MTALLAEAVTYFHSNAGFDRLFRLMRSKYRSYGRIGGRLELAQVTAAEAEALASLFGYNRYRGDVFSVLFKDVQPALDRTRFSGVVLEDLLAAYFRLPLRSRTEEQVLWEEERRVFFAALLAGVAGGFWHSTEAAAAQCRLLTRLEPCLERRDAYEKQYARYCALYRFMTTKER